jgi:hypothetical protein
MMTLAKAPLAVAGVVVLGLVLTGINAARHVEDKSQPTVKPHQTAASAHPQGSGGQPALFAQAADHSAPASPRPYPAQRSGVTPQYGYRTLPDGYMPGDMSDSIYGSLTGPDTAGPVVYWAPGRWYPYPGFGDKRVFMPQPEGVWGR